MAIDLSQLSSADLAAVVAHARAQESADREARKAERSKSREFVSRLVKLLATTPDLPAEQTFRSGAVGWNMGGKSIPVDMGDGVVKYARVQFLVRWEDTIPAADPSDDPSDDE